MSIQLAIINGITVTQDDDGRVHWKSKASIDADGSNGQNGNPFAYRRDNKGLDFLENAGWPDSWHDVLIDRGDGTPMSDENGNLYSQTAYTWKGRSIPTRYVDATAVPYIVVNPVVRIHARGVVIGCRGQITYNGVSVAAVVADVSGKNDIGEISIKAAAMLGIPSSPRTGGVLTDVQFEFWPGSAAVLDGEINDPPSPSSSQTRRYCALPG